MSLEETETPDSVEEIKSAGRASSDRRRPGLENRFEEKLEEKQEGRAFEKSSTLQSKSEHEDEQQDQQPNMQKIQIDFYGKDWLEARAPRAVRSMEIIAEDWVNDGRFEGLPLGHPLMQMLASKSLQKAKEIEKKLEEKGVFFIARTGLELVKSKVESFRKKDPS
jgi:hypothetical protein